MLTLFKLQVVSKLDYGVPLTNPNTQEIRKRLEGVQRSLTAKIIVPDHVNDYYERLKYLKLYSIHRRGERYTIIYMFKIIQGLVPNLTRNPIQTYNTSRHGMMCKIPRVTPHFTELFENSFCVRGPKLFNALPPHLRNCCGEQIKTDTFKHRLDAWLSQLKDEPPIDGVVLRTHNNSIANWKHLRCTNEDRTPPPARGGD